MNQKLNQIKFTIMSQAEINWHKAWLKETGLKIGDIVTCYFSCERGTRKQSYTTSYEGDGIIKSHANGKLYVESIKDLKFSHNVSNGRSGRSYKDWWEYEIRKGISNIEGINLQ